MQTADQRTTDTTRPPGLNGQVNGKVAVDLDTGRNGNGDDGLGEPLSSASEPLGHGNGRATPDWAEGEDSIRRLRVVLSSPKKSHKPVILQSAAMVEIEKTIKRLAYSRIAVLITGESGSGKEVVLDLLRALGDRMGKPVIKVNCAALPRELIEGELFGSMRGAFTGAVATRYGIFRIADDGIVLLDEVTEMNPDAQSKLLRVLQEREVRPVGGYRTYPLQCRIIATTNQDPKEAIKSGKLRQDLYYRLDAATIHVPSLRERRPDIRPLALAYLEYWITEENKTRAENRIGPVAATGFTPEALAAMERYDWPGNVRELESAVNSAVLMADGLIGLEHLPEKLVNAITMQSAVSDGGRTGLGLLYAMERNKIAEVLKALEGNIQASADRLGIGRQTLYNKIKKYGIPNNPRRRSP